MLEPLADLVGRYAIAAISIGSMWLWCLIVVARFWLIVLGMLFRC